MAACLSRTAWPALLDLLVPRLLPLTALLPVTLLALPLLLTRCTVVTPITLLLDAGVQCDRG